VALGLLLVSQGPHAPLEFTASAPAAARVGHPVPITLRLHNPTDRPLEAHFLGRTVAFDIVVTDASGNAVWRRLGEGAVPSILQIRTLAAGETMEWRDTWVPAAVGRYRIQGVLPSDDAEPLRTPLVETEVR
jgi:intracellular proteinase inhibitor BsuPI